MRKNIKYKSEGFKNFYSINRNSWEDFYESERYIIDKVLSRFHYPVSILDAGCGCGGLAKALSNRYAINFYQGIDINEPQIEYALGRNDIGIPTNFVCEDIANLKDNNLYDLVISLSCIDYNNEVNDMLETCWNHVKGGGYFITSIRLTNKQSINDITRAYQYINPESTTDNEVANYVVFNIQDILKLFSNLDYAPEKIEAYGYWGRPSPTAHIEYEELCFSVFALHKGETECTKHQINTNLIFPFDLYCE